jgi:hypothetical protein
VTLITSLLITLTVWAVSTIRSIRWRSLVYSLPLPISLALITTSAKVDGSQIWGVVALNLFFSIVALIHVRWGWPILVADALGVVAYIGLSITVAAFAPIPFWPSLLAVIVLWISAIFLIPLNGHDTPARPEQQWPGSLVKLSSVFGASLLMVAIGNLLKGFVVTFPYSGVLVAIETRHDLGDFTRHFARNSISLIAYFTGCYVARDRGETIAITAGWVAFALCAAALQLVWQKIIRCDRCRRFRCRCQHKIDDP